jgi:hypothetical protein
VTDKHYRQQTNDPSDVVPVGLTAETDGMFSPVGRARLEGWSGAAWIKVSVDSTGAVILSASGSTTPVSGTVSIAASTIPVTDNGGSLTVDGAVSITGTTLPVSGTVSVATSTVPITDNNGSLTVDQATASSLQATVTQGAAGASAWKVDGSAVTQPVSLASVPSHAVTNAGTFAVQVNASTVPITDNNGSLTVDGSISVTGSTVPITDNNGSLTVDGSVSLTGTTLPVSQNGTWTVQPGNTPNSTAWKVDGSAVTQPVSGSAVNPTPASTIATAVSSAAGAAITLSLASVAGQFHYISFLQILAYSTSARTGGATPVTVTTTNFTGNPSFTFQSAAAIGTSENQTFPVPGTLKSAAAATATTIVCPATAGVIWRVICTYYAGV